MASDPKQPVAPKAKPSAPLSERIMELAVSRGFLIPSAQIYNPPAGFYDYGPVGAAIKRKLVALWRNIFITRPGFLEIETSLVLPREVLIASGHAASFADPLAECLKEKKKFRADKLLEKATLKSCEGQSAAQLDAALKEHDIKCPDCGSPLGPVSSFNLMFATSVGTSGEANAFLRPETAQGIFLDFKRLFIQNGSKLPLAVGQVGKSFRNEISPRQGLVRAREFSQMELEYFFNPKRAVFEGFDEIAGKKVRIKPPADGDVQPDVAEFTLQEAVSLGYFPNSIMAAFVCWQQELYEAYGIPRSKFHFSVLPADSLPHYSKGNVDLEVETSYGFIETAGTAYRTDFDLSGHAKHSGESMEVFVPGEGEKAPGERIVPHVIEPSLGVDRPFYCILEHAYRPAGGAHEWEWFAFKPAIAPYTCGVFPLMKKDGLDLLADRVLSSLREAGVDCYYSQTGSIGKRYARADEIGVPYGITVDYQSKEDDTVTVRYRDDGGQERVKIGELASKLLALSKAQKTSLS
ncbi:MAG: glycine--tRNA ligase [Candidatus Micrarchaeota archaeon]